MTFPAAWVTSSQNIVLGLAQRATGSARLDKIYVIIALVLLELDNMSALVFLNLHWPLGSNNLLVTCHRQSCDLQAISYSGFCLDFVCLVAEGNAGSLYGDCRAKPWKVLCLGICKV